VSGESASDVLSGLRESVLALQSMLGDSAFAAQLSAVCAACVACYRQGGKLLVAGNGGSAADAQHFAGELVSRFYFDRPPLSAIALTTDSSILTAIGNDYGFQDVFSRQVLAHGRAGDVFIAISTSGNSGNILQAIRAAKSIGMVVVGLTGMAGGAMQPLCDYCFCAPSTSTPRIQECHLVIEHSVCAQVEAALFGNSAT
jgi:D-sedoheptulose 7-phosphate isomerase